MAPNTDVKKVGDSRDWCAPLLQETNGMDMDGERITEFRNSGSPCMAHRPH